ncbi:hypothetical protein Tcur_0023 [Thermomonospora curvata DSM 43183]|uniref:Uncharacterized protein n=1 Tax=Thermomonospora curvata (strain ATCC 19995 / DSM 43183 / JCM 3096 / KCTC 9072 / NBRC 15933 / NCIMB 10081 / Henssen B9) TaxID=471852 RepID=D1ADC1_THECD|nr:hypothetical protein Tcur_0023 [Thermomonospora curvata DSM 43183]
MEMSGDREAAREAINLARQRCLYGRAARPADAADGSQRPWRAG